MEFFRQDWDFRDVSSTYADFDCLKSSHMFPLHHLKVFSGRNRVMNSLSLE